RSARELPKVARSAIWSIAARTVRSDSSVKPRIYCVLMRSVRAPELLVKPIDSVVFAVEVERDECAGQVTILIEVDGSTQSVVVDALACVDQVGGLLERTNGFAIGARNIDDVAAQSCSVDGLGLQSCKRDEHECVVGFGGVGEDVHLRVDPVHRLLEVTVCQNSGGAEQGAL